MENSILPAGFNVRPLTWGDLEAVQQVIYAVCKAEGFETLATSVDELAQEWKAPGFTPETDAWVVTDPSGKVIGYEELTNRFAHASLVGDGYVHPEYLNLGAGTSLLKAQEARARQEILLAAPEHRVFIRNTMGSMEKGGHSIHTEAGFKAIRYTWQMEIQLDSEPAPIDLPENIELRPFDLDRHNHSLFLAVDEAFRDHWGTTPITYEFWQNHLSGHPDFDPSLWFVAWDGDQIAGCALCRPKQGIGWVGSLSVRRPWRKQGLGLGLLNHAFRQLFQRGYSTIGLMVDAANPTGATRLYERAGMQIANQLVTYEKELRPGLEPQELEN